MYISNAMIIYIPTSAQQRRLLSSSSRAYILILILQQKAGKSPEIEREEERHGPLQDPRDAVMLRPQESDEARPQRDFDDEEGVAGDDTSASERFFRCLFLAARGVLSRPHFAPEDDRRA